MMQSPEQDETDSDDDGFFLGVIGNKDEEIKHWSEKIEVNGVTIKFKLDTGADVMVFGDSIVSSFLGQNQTPAGTQEAIWAL